ncbi:MAG: hypothetical protein U9N84_05215 [Actinomycetota bacterium]|nr:hypothetical protein [Actinomycetota bacterium]
MIDPVARKLHHTRVARLHGAFRAPLGTGKEVQREGPYAKGELNLVVGVGRDREHPTFHIEGLNLVLDPHESLGGGSANPSASLPGASLPPVDFNPKTNEISAKFEMNLDFPAAQRRGEQELDPRNHTPGPRPLTANVELRGRFVGDLRAVEYQMQNLELYLKLEVPDQYVEELSVVPVLEFEFIVVLAWLFFRPRRQLCLQPVFISPSGTTPSTGSDFYPLLATANEIWAKCCVQFVAKCPPIYVDEQNYRIATTAEATAFKNEVDVDDAIEVFVVERLDPEDTWGGGATWGSGTAAAKIVTGDNQLPLNRNHLAHELGHVLGLGHPGDAGDGLVDGCDGSVMEPSGFFADNPEFQCHDNCNNAVNPLLCTLPWQWCLYLYGPSGDELF